MNAFLDYLFGHARCRLTIARQARELLRLRHDIAAYRGALGYALPGSHDGRLSDGTMPKCGICVARHGGPP